MIKNHTFSSKSGNAHSKFVFVGYTPVFVFQSLNVKENPVMLYEIRQYD